MASPAVPRLALAVSLLLGGCYFGPSEGLDALTMGGPGTASQDTGDATTDEVTTSGASGPTSDPTGGSVSASASASSTLPTTDATTDGSSVPSTDPTISTSGDDTTGAVDMTTGDGTTTAPMTTDPSSDPTISTSGDDTTGGADTGMMGNDDVPDNAYCAGVATWDPAWRQLEEDILVAVNQRRAMGANCGSKGNFGATTPLTMDPALRCAARKHSQDMAARNFFDHTNPDGESPWDRMAKAGYGAFSNAGENIAAGSPDAAGTMEQWMTSDGHCANIMSPDFQHIGVGYHTGGEYGHLWTQVFGAK